MGFNSGFKGLKSIYFIRSFKRFVTDTIQNHP